MKNKIIIDKYRPCICLIGTYRRCMQRLRMPKSILIFTIFFWQFAIQLHAQKQKILDSLWKEYNKATHDTTRIKTYLKIGEQYNNVPDSALFFYQKALDLADKNINKAVIARNEAISQNIKQFLSLKANSLLYIGIVHYEQGSYAQAIDYFLKSLKIDEELQDKNGIAIVYGNIAKLEIRQADSLEHQGMGGREVRLKKALEYGQKAMALAKEIKSATRVYYAASALQKAYKGLGNYKKALEYAEIFIETKDTIFSEEKTKALAKMQAQYEAEKRELTIQKLEKEKLLQNETIARKNEESKKQRILIFSFLAGFIIIFVFSIFLYRLYQ
ncbi:MAG: tetratricopeptide repeat protein, partial [Bacteroidia bacterium]|nr:tetratricopeptide repeat protein [Bacteroidia bacterium]